MSLISKSTSSENIDRLTDSPQEVASVMVGVPDSGAKVSESSNSENAVSLFEMKAAVASGDEGKTVAEILYRDLGFKGDIFLKYPKFLEKVASLPNERKEVLVSFFNAMFDLASLSDYFFGYDHFEEGQHDTWEAFFAMPSHKLQALVPVAQNILSGVDQFIDDDVSLRRDEGEVDAEGHAVLKKSSVRVHFMHYLASISELPQDLWEKATVLLRSILIYTALSWNDRHHFLFDPDNLDALVRFFKNKDIREIGAFVEQRFAYFDQFCERLPNQRAKGLAFAFLVKLIPLEILVPFYQRVEQLFKESTLLDSQSDLESYLWEIFLGFVSDIHVGSNSLQNLEANFWIFQQFKKEMTRGDLNFVGLIILPLLTLMSFSEEQVDILKSLESAVLKIESSETRFYFLKLLLNLPIEVQQKVLEFSQNEDQWLDLVSALDNVMAEDNSEGLDSGPCYDLALNFLYVIVYRMNFDMDELKSYWTKVLNGSDDGKAHFLYEYFDMSDLSGEHDDFMRELDAAGIRLGYLDAEGQSYYS